MFRSAVFLCGSFFFAPYGFSAAQEEPSIPEISSDEELQTLLKNAKSGLDLTDQKVFRNPHLAPLLNRIREKIELFLKKRESDLTSDEDYKRHLAASFGLYGMWKFLLKDISDETADYLGLKKGSPIKNADCTDSGVIAKVLENRFYNSPLSLNCFWPSLHGFNPAVQKSMDHIQTKLTGKFCNRLRPYFEAEFALLESLLIDERLEEIFQPAYKASFHNEIIRSLSTSESIEAFKAEIKQIKVEASFIKSHTGPWFILHPYLADLIERMEKAGQK